MKNMRKFKVLVDENSHHGDKDGRYEEGQYDTLAEATRVCKSIVDKFLTGNHLPKMTAEELYGCYTNFGEDPFIDAGDGKQLFSSWDYAKERCKEICDNP